MRETDIEYVVGEVVKRLNKNNVGILVEASGRHIHLSKEHVELLFGKGHDLTNKRELSQPGQYLCEESVTLIGSKGIIQNVSVLGPIRENTQVEISKTDAVSIGINAPVRISGDILDSGTAVIATSKAIVKLDIGVIVAKRHIHITKEDAAKFGVKNNEVVCVKILSDRGVIFTNVSVRVSDKFMTALHLDYDEANACGYVKGMRAEILK